MLKHYFILGLRHIWKNKGFSLINVVGLSLGLASILTLAMLVHSYYATDSFLEQKDRLYTLKTYTPDGSSYGQTTFPLLYEIQRSCPEVAAVTHWQGWNAPWLQYGSVEVQERSMYVDSGFFEVFSYPLSEGQPSDALTTKNGVVISQKVATALFGKEKALGKVIAASGVVSASDSVYLTVTGVLGDIPANASLKADVLLPLQLLLDNEDIRQAANWYNSFAENYLLLQEGADPALLDQKIAGLVQQFYVPEQKHNTVKTVPFSQLKQEGDPLIRSIITGAVASAFFILLIIVVNLLNLNTAQLFSRTKEMAVRRMMGSGRGAVLLQFCVENALLVVTALALGVYLFAQLLLPQLTTLMGSGLGEELLGGQSFGVPLLLIGLAALIIILVGSLPAWYLTSVPVSDGVKGLFVKANSRGWLRSLFITLQFSLAVVLIGVALILNSQIRYMKSASLGYVPEEVAVVNLNLAFKNPEQAESRFASIVQELRQDSRVKAVSTTSVIPTAYQNNFNVYVDVESGKEIHLRHAATAAGYAETFQIPMRAGRDFDDALAASESQHVVINQKVAAAFGWENPIGMQIREKGSKDVSTVIGVMEDFHYGSLQQPIEPLLHWYGGKPALRNNNFLSIRLDPVHRQAVLARLEQQFGSMPSRRAFSHTLMEARVENQYSLIEGVLMITNYVALLTIFIASMGLFGLVALFARQRVKEIGIRKVLGASVLDIAALLSKDFIRLVVIAVVIATPIAWWLMQQWLQDFAYRIDISWWFFAGAGLLALLIALATVSIQALKAARANPVKNLRTE